MPDRPTLRKKPTEEPAELSSLQLLRTLLLNVANAEAKLWGSLRFMIEKGLIDRQEYEGWMQEHAEEIAEVRLAFFERIAVELRESGLVPE